MLHSRKSLVGSFLLGVSVSALISSSAMAQGLESVTVTAQKRAENVQDVPVTVTVVSDTQLAQQNLLGNSDLVKAVPSLTITNFGDYQIRGIGTQGFAKSAERSVSFVLDGVVLQDTALSGAGGALYDVDHVEVLSGPQGLLFGKNATGGVVNTTTKAPKLDNFELLGHIDGGNFSFVNAHLIGNIPLGDDLALRIVGFYKQDAGILHNNFYDKDDYVSARGVRARLLWQPADNLRINLIADYDHDTSNGMGSRFDTLGVATYLAVDQTSTTANAIAARVAISQCPIPIVPGPNNNHTCANSSRPSYVPNSNEVYGIQHMGASVQVDYDPWPGYTLTSISAMRQNFEGNFNIHADVQGYSGDSFQYNNFDRNLTPSWSRALSQEVRLQSPKEDRLNYLVGAYWSKFYIHGVSDQAGQFGLPLGNIEFARVNNIYNQAEDYAYFGQANYNVTETLEVYAGARYTHNDIHDLTVNSFPTTPILSNASPPGGPFDPTPHLVTQVYTGAKGFFSLYPINTCTFAGGDPDNPSTCPAGTSMTAPARISREGASWKVGVNYHLYPDVMLFASASKGYKGPFIADQASFTTPITGKQVTVNPEYPLAFEVGAKSTVFDRVALDVTLFHDHIKGYQTTLYVPSVPGVTAIASFILGNAPYAETRGVDVSFFGNITDDLSINGGAIYEDAHFSPGFKVGCSAFEVGCVGGATNAIGQMPYAPKYKANISAEYKRPLFDNLEGFVNADIAYTGIYYYSADSLTIVKSTERTIFGARAGVRSEDGQWGLSVWCRNCFDHRYPGNITAGDPANGPTTRQQFLTLDSYRTFGISLEGKL